MAVAALVAAAAVGVGGCGSPAQLTAARTSTRSSAPDGRPAPGSTRAPLSAPTEDCPLPDSGFDCDFQRRFTEVLAYLDTRPGAAGVVVHDLRTGALWHNDHSADLIWTASTIKLAMVVDLFTRAREGAITLTDEDRALIEAMLHSSDDDAANTLWLRYAGADHTAYNDRFPAYGMTSLTPQEGYSEHHPYWGFQKCTAEDLDRLMHHVLTELPGDEREYIVGQLRSVAENQRWGVWGAGPSARPGNKNGWADEDGGWVMNSVGFVGDGERYTLSVMNDLRGEGAYDEGRETTTRVSELLFAGRF